MNQRQTAAFLQSIFATLIWGWGFIATKTLLMYSGPFWLNALRYGLATGIGFLLLLSMPKWRSEISFKKIRLSMCAGLSLGAFLILQTIGLKFTTVAKSGFITTLYILFVPLIKHYFYKAHMNATHWLWILISLVGTCLMTGIHELSINKGDLATLVGTMIGSFQIIQVEKDQRHITSPVCYNVFQSFWVALMTLPLAFVFDNIEFRFLANVSMASSLFYLVVMSTTIGFALQVMAQKSINAQIVSLIFLLEAPFAAYFGYIHFGEALSLSQAIGAGLIIFSAVGVCIF